MTETRRLLEAAAALSRLLNNHGIAHAFHGNVLTAVLANGPQSNVCPDNAHRLLQRGSTECNASLQEIACICEGGPHHPFRRVRDAMETNDDFTTTLSPWTNR